MHIKLEPTAEGVGKALDLIQTQLTRCGVEPKRIGRTMLAAEETIHALLDHGKDPQAIHLSIRRLLGDVYLELSVAGEAFDFEEELTLGEQPDADLAGPEAVRAIRRTILRSFVDELRYRSRSGRNTVRITVVKARRAVLYRTLCAMALAVLLGAALQLLGRPSFCLGLDRYVLQPFKTMYLNGLKTMVTPVVFFSIVSCVGQFSNLSEMGRIGGKTLAAYLLTTCMATGVGLVMFQIFRPGGAAAAGVQASPAVGEGLQLSLTDTVVGIVPSNIVQPFLEANMLQLILLAVVCGIAVSMIGPYSRILQELFAALNELFLKIMHLLVQLIPLAAFSGLLSMILATGAEALVSIAQILGVFILGLLVMLVLYALLLLLMGRLNPICFFRKYAPYMIQVFSIGTCSAALPLNMEACRKLGVSHKVYALTLPLGATVNMDGTCIYLGISALALAKIFGVSIPPAAILPLVISIVVLSFGAPSMPGSGLICLSVLLTQLGVPTEALAMMMGIDTLVSMIRAMSNATGDLAVCCIVAAKEGLLDRKQYKA